jgi:S-formylglutathione hydrolase FrmB
MGGYGAFKLALARPGDYAAGMSLSGALAALDRPGNGNAVTAALRRAVGEPHQARGTIADLDHLARRVGGGGGPAPRLWACCGTADFLYEENLAFGDRAAAAGLAIDWRFDEGAAHEWGYWDGAIVRAMDWLMGGDGSAGG